MGCGPAARSATQPLTAYLFDQHVVGPAGVPTAATSAAGGAGAAIPRAGHPVRGGILVGELPAPGLVEAGHHAEAGYVLMQGRHLVRRIVALHPTPHGGRPPFRTPGGDRSESIRRQSVSGTLR